MKSWRSSSAPTCGEMERLATEHGVPSFKIFMFYGGHGLHGAADPFRHIRLVHEIFRAPPHWGVVTPLGLTHKVNHGSISHA